MISPILLTNCVCFWREEIANNNIGLEYPARTYNHWGNESTLTNTGYHILSEDPKQVRPANGDIIHLDVDPIERTNADEREVGR